MSLRGAFVATKQSHDDSGIASGFRRYRVSTLAMTGLIFLPLLHRQDKIIGILRQFFHHPVRANVQSIFDAEAHAFFGIIQARLGGDHHTGRKPLIIARGQAAKRAFVNIQPTPCPKLWT